MIILNMDSKMGSKQIASALEISSEEMTLYRTTARHLQEQENKELIQRKERAWEVARSAATLLKEKFNVTRVAIFGSLVHEGCFTRWSDVDIAAWGIPPEDTFRAMGAVMDMDESIEVNLVDVKACSASLLDIIEQEGIEL